MTEQVCAHSIIQQNQVIVKSNKSLKSTITKEMRFILIQALQEARKIDLHYARNLLKFFHDHLVATINIQRTSQAEFQMHQALKSNLSLRLSCLQEKN